MSKKRVPVKEHSRGWPGTKKNKVPKPKKVKIPKPGAGAQALMPFKLR